MFLTEFVTKKELVLSNKWATLLGFRLLRLECTNTLPNTLSKTQLCQISSSVLKKHPKCLEIKMWISKPGLTHGWRKPELMRSRLTYLDLITKELERLILSNICQGLISQLRRFISNRSWTSNFSATSDTKTNFKSTFNPSSLLTAPKPPSTPLATLRWKLLF